MRNTNLRSAISTTELLFNLQVDKLASKGFESTINGRLPVFVIKKSPFVFNLIRACLRDILFDGPSKDLERKIN